LPPSSAPTATNTTVQRPTATATAPAVATSQPSDPPIAILTPEPTDFPVAVPPPTSTPPQITAGAVPDLVATSIEVTQGMQNLANEMPLVEDRLTVARVYVKTQDPPNPVANVKGALAAFRDGQFIGQVYPENQPINAVANGGLRTNVDDSLWFYVPGAWTTGEITLRTFVYSSTPDAPYEQEPDASNNVAEATVEFHPANLLKVRFVPLHTHTLWNPANADKTYHYDEHEFDSLQIVLDILRLHPIATNALVWNASSILTVDNPDGPDIAVTSVKPIGHQDGVEWDFTGTDKQLANERTAFFKSMSPEGYDDYHWYGMVDPSHCLSPSCGVTGWASSNVALGKMDVTTPDAPWDVIGGYVLSHEIAHLLLSGDDHINCTGNESGPDLSYPYGAPNCSLAAVDPEGWYGFDVYWQLWGHYLDGPTVISNDPAAPWPNQAFPMMGSKSPQYVDPWDYCRLLDSHGVTCDHLTLGVAAEPGLRDRYVASGPAPADRERAAGAPGAGDERLKAARVATQSGTFAYVSAVVDTAAGTARILDVMPLAEVAPGVLADAQERHAEARLSSLTPEYELFLESASGVPLVSYPMTEREPFSHETEQPAGASILFADVVEFPEGTEAVRVRRAGSVIAQRVASASAPVVQLLSPNGGEQLTGASDVRWQASDPDGDALTFTIMYSTDAGESWTPVATDLRGGSVTLPSMAGLAGSDRALLRVIASDGLRVTSDDSDAPFMVPNNPPLPYIVSPADGAELAEGATVLLTGGAQDVEDGALSADALAWQSSVDGDLGSGAEISTRSLSLGEHTIVLSATDAVGTTAERSVDITIVDGQHEGVPSADEQQGIERGLGLRDDDGGSNARWIAFAGAAAAAAAASVGGFALARSRSRRR
jgi:hypothetical protein